MMRERISVGVYHLVNQLHFVRNVTRTKKEKEDGKLSLNVDVFDILSRLLVRGEVELFVDGKVVKSFCVTGWTRIGKRYFTDLNYLITLER